MRTRRSTASALGYTLVLTVAGMLSATPPEIPRVLPAGELPADARLGPLVDLDGEFIFTPPADRASWEKRAADVRRRVLVSMGLWPMPPTTPLRPAIYGRSARDGFTVEKVHFESLPGHFVTGLLFRPEEGGGRRAAVLSPHGHGGRLHDYGAEGVRRLIVAGAERFEGSGRYPKLARCAQLARMGCVTFIFDMLGYADSVQIPMAVAHRLQEPRAGEDTNESWRFFSTQAELRLQSILGLQMLNALRALDFLAGLPDVDPDRIAVTGGSGGGTQTILLGAIDPRPVASYPQGMVSTSMQGGCTCENASLLRIGTGNVELAALFAPRPQAMTAANDWTRELMTKGYPALQTVYDLYDARDRVHCEALLHFPHNYNYVTRALMYSWFNQHLRLGLEEPIVEEDFRPLTPAEWTVWDDEHPAPPGGEEHERAVTHWLDEAAREALAAIAPRDADTASRFREVVGGAFATIIGRELPAAKDIVRVEGGRSEQEGYIVFTDRIRNAPAGEELPVVSLYPRGAAWNGEAVLWIDGAGKASLFGSNGSPRATIASLLERGFAVVGADLFRQGEFLREGEVAEETRKVANPRPFAGFTFGYNHALFARRVHDVLTLIAFALHDEHGARRLHLVGAAGAGPWVAAARALAGEAVARAAIDTRGFRFASLTSWRDPAFLPGAVKYGDVPALLALGAPGELFLADEKAAPQIVRDAYATAGAAASLTLHDGKQSFEQAAAEWLATARDR